MGEWLLPVDVPPSREVAPPGMAFYWVQMDTMYEPIGTMVERSCLGLERAELMIDAEVTESVIVARREKLTESRIELAS